MEEMREDREESMREENAAMEKGTCFKTIQPAVFGCVLAVCITFIICTGLLCRTIVQKKRTPSGSSITATGSASVDFESDIIVWRGSFLVHGNTLEQAYEKIRRDGELIKDYLKECHIEGNELEFGSVNITKKTAAVYDEDGKRIGEKSNGYDLKQPFVVTSGDVDKVTDVSRDISELIASGVELESGSPEYYYSDLDALKMQLVEAAAANARERIELMAGQTGAEVGKLTTASLGVFQITAYQSGTNDYGATGTLNTSSRLKTAMITVRLSYMVK